MRSKRPRRYACFYEIRLYMLSNFSAHSIVWNGEVWPTAEHAYQASKFSDHQVWSVFLIATSPARAKELAREVERPRRADWNEVKLQVMEEILTAKMLQHPEVRTALLSSGNDLLVENSPTDSFWGWGRDRHGLNHLGKLWMRIRENLRAGKFPPLETA